MRKNSVSGYLEKGIYLFNKSSFFEAHEEWERQWHGTKESPERHFIQGMIMIAAAMHHYKKREYAGTLKLLEKGISLLKEHKEANIPIDKEDFLTGVVGLYERVRSSDISEKDFPIIKLIREEGI